jgi:hypothetical protein
LKTLGEAFNAEQNRVEEDICGPEILRREFHRVLKDLIREVK